MKKRHRVPDTKILSAARLLAGAVLLITLVNAGCTPDIPVPENTVTVTAKDSNNSFDQAQPVTVTPNQPVRIDGRLSWSGDIDVFSLGTLQKGQTVSIDVKSKNIFENTDIVVGLFDESEDVAVLDEDVVSTAAGENLSLTVRKPGNYYLAILLFSAPGLAGFNYSMTVVLGSAEIPAPAPQSVYLNFNGGKNIVIGSDTFASLRPFSELPNGLGTAAVAEKIAAQVQAYYPDLDIQILSSYDVAEPTGPHTVVFVCANGGNYYGLADQIDWYNQDLDDRAVVFTGLLATSNLTQTQFIVATANVVAHELGHLVGLVHTTDHAELMDQSTPLSLLAENQDFHRAPLPQNEFPIGWQDSAELLQFSLGLLQP